jgi:hypothetical protein
MPETDRKLDAKIHALGWVTLIFWLWVVLGWIGYLGLIGGWLSFLPADWWPSTEVVLIFIGVAKLMGAILFLAWLGLVLYRRHLRRP